MGRACHFICSPLSPPRGRRGRGEATGCPLNPQPNPPAGGDGWADGWDGSDLRKWGALGFKKILRCWDIRFILAAQDWTSCGRRKEYPGHRISPAILGFSAIQTTAHWFG